MCTCINAVLASCCDDVNLVISLSAGILLSNGYWYSFSASVWQQKRFPPYAPLDRIPNELYTFRGRPTIFGAATCDGNGECEYTDVIQYMSEEDKWKSVGKMLHTRQFHEVIEVPLSFCEIADPAPPRQDTAALIVGGIYDININDQNGMLTPSAELFGCLNSDYDSIPLEDYPLSVTLPGGVYFSDGYQDAGRVLVCGGYTCTDTDSPSACNVSPECYEWTPEDQWSRASADLNDTRLAHIMALAPDFDSGSSKRVPLVLGAGPTTEIYDPVNEVWRPYRTLSIDSNDLWLSYGCLTQYEDSIYHISDSIFELNLFSWKITIHGPVPSFLNAPAKCSVAVINDNPGKIVRLKEIQRSANHLTEALSLLFHAVLITYLGPLSLKAAKICTRKNKTRAIL